MGRRRRSVAPCDDALRALITWVDTHLYKQELSDTQLARKIPYDRSQVTRALSGKCMPPWPMIEWITTKCDASGETARKLWVAADTARRMHLARDAEGYPPPGLDDYPAFCRALRELVEKRKISQRELVRQDETGLLRRSTVGAVLRMQRSARRDITIAIVRACGVSDAAVDSWAAAWDRLARPYREAMERRRRQQRWQVAYGRPGARSRWWGGPW